MMKERRKKKEGRGEERKQRNKDPLAIEEPE
jgi:hypothetical protein